VRRYPSGAELGRHVTEGLGRKGKPMDNLTIRSVGKDGKITFFLDDIMDAQATQDHVRIKLNSPGLRYMKLVNQNEGFQHLGYVVLDLVEMQVGDLLGEIRKLPQPYCKPCFDFGKTDDPGQCLRCNIIQAAMDAWEVDMRRGQYHPRVLPEISRKQENELNGAVAVATAILLTGIAITLVAHGAPK
jgi:hypothetical protein